MLDTKKNMSNIEYEKAQRDMVKQKKVQESNLFVTTTTNIRPLHNEDARKLGNEFKAVLDEMYTEHFADILHFRKGSVADLIDVDVEFAVELGTGKQGGRIHHHAIVRVKHTANIQIAPKLLNAYVLDHMPRCLGPYTHIKLLPRSRTIEDLREYIYKTLQQNKKQ